MPGVPMTIVQLKKQMDRRFRAVDVRFKAIDRRFDGVDRRFDSLEDKLDAMMRYLRSQLGHLTDVVDNHEQRIQELERTKPTSA
jgi:hypothetical protein